ncbi:MAG: tetratricopeptide repeat protein [Deltaproteobacteria bacterium]|nr:tetratricopeptide repeat protein [Deltaproteobacteria bacterium]
MYNLLISIAAGLVGFLIFRVAGLTTWQSILPGLVALVGSYFYLARRTGKIVEEIFARVGKELQQRKLDKAVELLEAARPLGKWQFLMEAQLDAQIGILLYVQKKFDEAEPHLAKAYKSKAFVKIGTANAMLAAQFYRRKEWAKMEETFEGAITNNKGDSLLYAVFAWCQDKRGEAKKSIEVLTRGVKEVPSDAKLKTLLERAQNDKRLKLDAFGEQWYQFWLESPPMVQQGGFGGGGFGLRGMRGGGRRMR